MVTVKRIQHVSLPRPPGSESADTARGFYSGILGLEEIQRPSTLQKNDLVWFKLGDQELHLFSESLAVDWNMERHLCLEVDDVDTLKAELSKHGYSPSETTPIRNRPRFFCRDPFGNQIEFTTIIGEYS